MAAARSYIGVRFRHQGRNRHGLDCIGLAVSVAQELGLTKFDYSDYQKHTNGHEFMARLRESGVREVAWADRQPGDLVVMHDRHFPCHVGILSGVCPDRMVHAYVKRRAVVEELFAPWRVRLVGAYRMPGVANAAA